MNTIFREKRYLTPYIAWLNVLGNDGARIGEFMRKVAQLPTDAQTVLKSFSTAEFIEDQVATHFNLDDQQVNHLTLAIKDLLVGRLQSENFVPSFQSSLNIHPETSQQIATMLYGGLLSSVFPNIKNLQLEKFPEKTNNSTQNKPHSKRIPGINKNNIVDLRNPNNL